MLPPPPSIEHGVAGAGPQREYARRVAKREAQLDKKWGRLAPVAKFLSNEPQSTTAWRTGAEGERRLAAHLDREVGSTAVILHSRCVPRSSADIDHLVIAPSGVWIVDAKNYSGKVERRDVGSWWVIDHRLFVNNRDRTALVDGMQRQVDAVRSALDPMGLATLPVHPALVFTNSEWGLFAKPFDIRGVRILWAKRLCELIVQPGSVEPTRIDAIARQLSSKLPPKAA